MLCRAAPGIAGNRASCAAPLHPDAALDRLDGVRAWFAARDLPLHLTLSDRLLAGAAGLTPVVQPTDVLTAAAGSGTPDSSVLFARTPDAGVARPHAHGFVAGHVRGGLGPLRLRRRAPTVRRRQRGA